MKYIVNIIETMTKQIEVDAANETEARRLIEPAYENGEIIIDGTTADTFDYSIQVVKADEVVM